MRIVVIMPNWLGDAVMATPFLRGLRNLHPDAHIAAVGRPLVNAVVNGLPFVSEIVECKKGEEGKIAGWMKREKFDMGITLPNSFRSAWMLWRGGVKRRLGFDRGGRSWLLTDTAPPILRTESQRAADRKKSAAIARLGGGKSKIGTPYEPLPAIDFYLELLRVLQKDAAPPASRRLYGAAERRMELAVTDAERAEAEATLAEIENQKSKTKNLITIVPGANFGASKCWMPERFADVAQKLTDPAGPFRAHVLLAGSPAEMPIIDAILAAVTQSRDRITALPKLNGGRGISIGALKEVVRRSRLIICNDTGPRHFAAALGVPVVTLFGPTDPRWAETFFEKERIVRIDVPCGPCQLKKCPIDHRCMKGISVEMVLAAALELWKVP